MKYATLFRQTEEEAYEFGKTHNENQNYFCGRGGSERRSDILFVRTKRRKVRRNLGDIAVFAAIDHIIRKLAHFSEYALLGINLSVFIFTFDKKIPFTAICTVTSSFLYACTDEFHQYFVPARSAQFTDVLIDTLGAAAGAAAFVLFAMIKKRIKQNRIKTRQQ